ncbi:MAG: DNA methylase N-4/N-6 domain protein [Candidatus Scalindua rubra]|uniref:Methyltransferase n=1 Tax=Candidatus Scalindua rubra TaxID=1872076 RepID=A0A1E3XH59_9BACT|nr:MAG: DNA methylase N-4/N-6 domain protein [Candidatus Scalindua rubra]
MESKLLLNTKEAASFLGISTATIYRMEKKGLVASVRTPGGQRRFSKKILEEYLKESSNIEAPQNPSKYKRTLLTIKEPETAYGSKVEKVFSQKTVKAKAKTNPYFHSNLIWIYNGDFLKTTAIEEKSVDLIITSPPYNVDIKYNSHDDRMSYKDYLSFTKLWLAKCYALSKDDGRFCLNIPLDKNKGGQQSVCADITTIAKEVGWTYHSTIIWNEQNISRRTAWGSWLSASAPYVIAPVEVIVVFYKNSWKKTSGSRKSDITKEEFIEWTNGVWTFSGESKKRVGHPSPFPVELPKRCVKLFSFVGDTVVDPFLGSGSTLIACYLTRRRGIGIDIDRNYCKLAKQRLNKECEINQNKFTLKTKTKIA